MYRSNRTLVLDENPLRRLRIANGLTMKALSELAEVSMNLIIRNEQGMYSNPSPVLCYFFSHHAEVSEATSAIVTDYLRFQRSNRQLNYGMLIEPPHYVSEVTTDLSDAPHPFMFWRFQSNLNLTQVAKAFCVQQSLLHKFENQPHLCYSLPEPLVHALLEAGYSSQTIDNEQRWFQLYREQLDKRTLEVKVPEGLLPRGEYT